MPSVPKSIATATLNCLLQSEFGAVEVNRGFCFVDPIYVSSSFSLDLPI